MVCGEKKKPFLGAFPSSSEEEIKNLVSKCKKVKVWNISFGTESMENGLEKYPNSSLICVVFG